MNIENKIRDLYVRLFEEKADSAIERSEVVEDEPPVKKSKIDELNEILLNQNKKPVQTSTLLSCVKKEISFFELSGELPKILKSIKNSLDILPPSSVEAERCFSASGLFVTKLRSRLSDTMIDNLCLMRGYLLRK